MNLPMYEPLRLLVGLAKAHVLGKFYDPETAEFVDFAEIPHNVPVMMPNTSEFEPRGKADLKYMWYRLLLKGSSLKETMMKMQKELKSETGEDFFLAAQMIVTYQVNLKGHPFRNAFFGEQSEERLVYRFDQKPNLKEFTFITSSEARELVTEGAAIRSAFVPVVDLQKLDGVWFYPDLLKPWDSNSPLKEKGLLNIVTKNITWYQEHITSMKKKYGEVIKPIQFQGKPDAQPEPPVAPKVAPPKKTQPNVQTTTQSVKSNAPPTANAEEAERERIKKEWAPEVIATIVTKLTNMCKVPAKKASIYGYLKVAAGLAKNDPNKKKDSTVFNLHTARLLLRDNNDSKVIIAEISPLPLFKSKFPVQLAVDAKNPDIKWFTEGPNVRRTSGNTELSAWVRESIIPKVWEKFVRTNFQDYIDVDESGQDADEGTVEDRIEKTSGIAGTEEKVSKPAFKKTFKPQSELGFALRYVATLPMLPDELKDDIGGDTSNVMREKASITETVLKLGSDDETTRLRLIAKNVNDLFKLDTPSSLISQVRGEMSPKPADVKRSDAPFIAKTQQTGTAEQMNVDFRQKVRPKATSSEESDA